MRVDVVNCCWLQLVLFSVTLSEECKKISPCKCSNSKGVIDLAKLDTKSQPKFSFKAPDLNIYTYNPCTTYDLGSTCLDILSCQEVLSSTTSDYYPLATADSVAFNGDPDDNTLQITASSTFIKERKLHLKLQCADVEGEFSGEGETSPLNYYLTLRTRYACYNGIYGGISLSIGSILVIIFFVLLFVYVMGGFLLLTFVKKAKGADRFPNLPFWKEIPLLIKDGAKFAVGKLRRNSTYDQI